MKNFYEELKNKHQQEMNAFPIGACFSQKQFEEMMQKWGLTVHDTDKICSIGGGSYVRKSDYKEFIAMGKRFEKERKDAIVADKTGDGYIYQMFLYELANHTALPMIMKIHLTRSGLPWTRSTRTNGFYTA